MQVKKTLIAFALSLAATSTLFASEIYKWTDEEGNVYFSDRPTVGAEHLAIRSRPTDPDRVRAEVQAEVDRQSQKAAEVANAPQGPTPQEQRAEAREREEKCNQYTERQIQFTQNRRIYRMNENGERVYYDEAEMAAARARVDGLVDDYCN